MCILIITIPFGVASFRIAGYALWPFGRVVVRKQSAGGGSVIGNIIWFILAGWWLAIAQVAFGVVLCITIIGIPFGIASFKMAGLAVAPLGKEIVSRDDVRAQEALYGTGYPPEEPASQRPWAAGPRAARPGSADRRADHGTRPGPGTPRSDRLEVAKDDGHVRLPHAGPGG